MQVRGALYVPVGLPKSISPTGASVYSEHPPWARPGAGDHGSQVSDPPPLPHDLAQFTPTCHLNASNPVSQAGTSREGNAGKFRMLGEPDREEGGF